MAIQILPSELANQIAAGEVVERPASIIKELVENSVDAGASRIDIDIEQGGCKLIRIRDNGCGIPKDELALALARHATSKIKSLDDLETIMSLGFRGEALASISSVSRLTLTSKPETQSEAWLVYAEGRDMQPISKPTSHPTGTTVEVLDIFYNTPARRRFLKTEKTEFSHIDEVIRRIALACPMIIFNLQHNGKLVRQYRVSDAEPLIEKRIATIFGPTFMQKAIKLAWQHDMLSIEGWIAPNNGQEQIQYFYVNKRVVRDRLLNHAMKQAFQEVYKPFIHSTDETLNYIIYLELDPHQVDVNVHPAKHEVRFHEARLVHDFVHQAIVMALDQQQHKKDSITNIEDGQLDVKLRDNRVTAGQSIFNTEVSQDTQEKKADIPSYSTAALAPKKTSHIEENHLYARLIDQPKVNHTLREDTISEGQQAIIASLFPARSEPLIRSVSELSVSSAAKLGKVLTIINNAYILLEKNENQQQKISLLSLQKAQLAIFNASLRTGNDRINMERLLIPLSLLLSKQEQQQMNDSKLVLMQFNLEFYIDKSKLQLTAVPKLMRKANWQQLLPDLINFLLSQNSVPVSYQQISQWFSERYLQIENEQQHIWDIPKAIQTLAELEKLDDNQCNMAELIKPLDLSATIALF